jgi:hypothetical protein
MSAVPISQLVRSIIAHCDAMMGFQSLLNACDCAADRKTLILEARQRGMIGDDDARLLIEAYQLETA